MKKLITLFFLLAVALEANAETVQVTLGCANNGDGTSASCAASPGGVGAYNSIEYAVESNATKDRVTATDPYIVECNVGATDLEDLGGGTVSNASYTTSASYYLEVRSADPSNKCRIRSTASSVSPFRYEASGGTHTYVRHLVHEVNVSGSGQAYGVRMNNVPTGARLEMEGNIYKMIGSTTGRCYGALLQPPADNIQVKFWNNHVEDFDGCDATYRYGIEATCIFRSTCVLAVYNNTAVGNGRGIVFSKEGTSPSLHMKNNLMCNNSTADYTAGGGGGTLTTATNMTCDTSSPDGASYQSAAITFDSAGLPDTTSGSDNIDAGTDLSADGQLSFSDDYIGTSRSGTWDIGAFEGSFVTSNAALFRRIRE